MHLEGAVLMVHKPIPLPATKANVEEIRHNVIMELRDMADLKKCGCPACLVAFGQLVETRGVKMINDAIKAYETHEDIELVEILYELRNLIQGVIE